MVTQAMGVQLSHLLDTGLPEDALDSLGAPSGVISADGMTALVRDAASHFTLATDATQSLSDLVHRLLGTVSPLDTATAVINYKYQELGAAGGILGSSTSAVTASTDGIGFYRLFAKGAIYWSPATGAHEVHGAIRAKWSELGGERGFLGYPTTDQTPGRDAQSRGDFNHFQGGSIFWHPGLLLTGVTAVGGQGLSLATLAATPAVTPASPAPAISALRVAAAATAAMPIDVAATIASTPATSAAAIRIPAATAVSAVGAASSAIGQIVSSAGAFEVHGAILAKYLELGGETSILGYPTSDEGPSQGGVGRVSHFEAGDIYWTTNTGADEVHALIRDFWLAHGGNQGNFGFPISDELIPDRRLGHVRPETKRKPVLSLPADVIKLPAGASDLGFPAPVVNNAVTRAVSTPLSGLSRTVAAASQPASGVQLAGTAAASAIDRGTVGSVIGGFGLGGITGGVSQASNEAPTRSDNRFEDFESGVLFWQRGATAATQLSPWLQASDGTNMHWTAAQIQAAAQPLVTQAFSGLSGFAATHLAYLGTTAYSFDGAGVHNRRHRFSVQLNGGLLGIVPMPVVLEIHVEAAFEPLARKVIGYIANWVPLVVPALNNDPMGQLHRTLDPVLWGKFDLVQLPDTDNGDPIAVLSVKTLPNGDVNVYIEPTRTILSALGSVLNTGLLSAAISE